VGLIQSNAAYGVTIGAVNATDFTVSFGNGGNFPSGAYGNAGAPWSSIGSWRWRVTKVSGGAAVGFGAATTTQSGLVTTGVQSFAGVKTFEGGANLVGAASSPSSTVTLTNVSNSYQALSPTGAINCDIVGTGIVAGTRFNIENTTANVITFRDGGGTTITTLRRGWIELRATAANPTATQWAIAGFYQDPIPGYGGTFTPNTSNWVVSGPNSLAPGYYEITVTITSDSAGGVSTNGVRANLSTGTSTIAAEDYSFAIGQSVGNFANNGARGGCGVIFGYANLSATTNFYVKAVAFNANFVAPITWVLVARRLR